MKRSTYAYLILLVLPVAFACEREKAEQLSLFTRLPADSTHVDFANNLHDSRTVNIYTFRNFYNGGGVGIGDINNDGLPDLFFTANMVANRLFLNQGNFKFKDITAAAGFRKGRKWSTGVTMADVNGDGWLDIYICNSAYLKGDRANELYINNGDLTFTECADSLGVADKGLSTHAAFFDYDHDGDLDLFVLNNSFKPVTKFDLRRDYRSLRDSIGGDKLLENRGGKFIDVSEKAGIYGSAIGFGLGVTVGDVNDDGWDDIYVSNDFFERDYLYINNKNGTFSEELQKRMSSISNTSMGADMADMNNDGLPEIFVTDMLPSDNRRLKSNTIFESWEKYQFNLTYGYHHQFNRNTLQFNRGHGRFQEIGRYAGVEATDWSWGALLADMDGDGLKDIFVANGMYKDITNGDFVEYLSSPVFNEMVKNTRGVDFKKFIDLIPSEPISNYSFRNTGNLTFVDNASRWGLGEKSFSNGAAYGDLDNDGDLDLVVNNINMPASVYRNNSELVSKHDYLRVKLSGDRANTLGVGAKLYVYYNDTAMIYVEQMPTRGFQSSVDPVICVGLGSNARIDSVKLRWQSGKVSVAYKPKSNSELVVKEATASTEYTPHLEYKAPLFSDISSVISANRPDSQDVNNALLHERLLFSISRSETPHLSVGDIDGDGLDDFLVTAGSQASSRIYLQKKDGTFEQGNYPMLNGLRLSTGIMVDADGDKDLDLVAATSTNNSREGETQVLFFANEGKAGIANPKEILRHRGAVACIAAGNMNSDALPELFVGTRRQSHQPGLPSRSYILINRGSGVFADQTGALAPELAAENFSVSEAVWSDVNNDGATDLLLAGGFMPLKLFVQKNNKLVDGSAGANLNGTQGWWNTICVADLNNDGAPDIVAGNLGLNSRFRASPANPLEIYLGDFDQNGTPEGILSTTNEGVSKPLASRQDLMAALPGLKKGFPDFASYGSARTGDVLNALNAKNAIVKKAVMLSNCVFFNDGKGTFTRQELPQLAQLSSMHAITCGDFDGDSMVDIIAAGNNFHVKPDIGIDDASVGWFLKGTGNNSFKYINPDFSGISIEGQISSIVQITAAGNKTLVIGRPNRPLLLLKKVR